MTEIEGMIRKWGNSSLAFVIPKEIAEKEKIEPNKKLKVSRTTSQRLVA